MTTSLLAQRLRTERARADLSQAELAKRVGSDQAIISRIERGTSMGTPELLQAVARELKTTVSYLLGDQVQESGATYAVNHPARQILADYDAPIGLRDLASDKALIEMLRIGDEEWNALRSLQLPREVTKEGYVQLLMTIRAVTGGRLGVV